MPGIVGAISAAIASFGFAAGVTTALTYAVIGAALIGSNIFLQKVLRPKQPRAKDGFGSQLDSSVASAPSRRIVYGEVHTGGIRSLIATTENPNEISPSDEVKNEMLHVVMTYCGHASYRVKALFLGTYPINRTQLIALDGYETNEETTVANITIPAFGVPSLTDMRFVKDGRYAMGVKLLKGENGPYWGIPVAVDICPGDEGDTTQPFPYLATALPDYWNGSKLQARCTKVHYQMMYSGSRFPQGLPNLSAIIMGKLCKDPRDNSDFDLVTADFTRNPAVIGLDFLLLSTNEGGFGATEAEIDFDSIETAANVCDEFITIADSTHSGYWETTCDQDAEPTLYPRVITAEEPDVSRVRTTARDTILIDNPITPPRLSSGDRVKLSVITGALPSGVSAGTNYYVHVDEPWPAPADRRRLKHSYYLSDGQPMVYLTDYVSDGFDRTADTYFLPRISLHTSYEDGVKGDTTTRVDLGTIGTGRFKIYKTGEPRYTCDLVFDVDKPRRETLEEIAGSMGGEIIYTGGKWIFHAGAYETPTVTLDEDDCAGPLSVQTARSMRDTFSSVSGLYTLHYESRGEFVNYPVVTSGAGEIEDNEATTAELNLPATTRLNMAQRIAQIVLLKSRQQITFEQDFNWAAYQLRAGSFFKYTNERMGWDEKVFQCLRWQRLYAEDGGVGRVYFRVAAQEIAAEVYESDPALLEVEDLTPNTELPNAYVVGDPSNITITEAKRNPSGSIVETVTTVTWDAPGDGFVEFYEIQWRKSAKSDGTAIPVEVEPFSVGVIQRETTLEIVNLDSPYFWTFRIRARTHIGVVGEWIEYEKEIIGLSDRPQTPLGLNAVAIGGMAYLSWPQSTDIDVIFGGEVQIRMQQTTDMTITPTWAESFTLTRVPGESVSASVPLLTGFYSIKFVDSQGNESLNAAFAFLQAVSSTTYTTEYQIRQETTFDGTKYNCNVNGDNELELDTVTGIVEPEGVYEFDLSAYSGLFDSHSGNFDDGGMFDSDYAYISGGGTRLVRAVIDYNVSELSDLFDSHTGLFDSGLNFDSQSGSEGDVWVEYRKTDDNPDALTANWTEWARVDAAEIDYEGIEFRAQLRSYEPQGQVQIASLGVDILTPA